MTKFQLFSLLARSNNSQTVTVAGVTGLLQSIEREDGSGHNFNVTLSLADNTYTTVFVKTVD